jgi:Na+/proline symporter
MEDYFLGGRQLPWWALGVSGMASFLDLTGTMIITSFLFMMGPRGLFVEFRGGAVLVLALMMLWSGKCIDDRLLTIPSGSLPFGDTPGGHLPASPSRGRAMSQRGMIPT